MEANKKYPTYMVSSSLKKIEKVTKGNTKATKATKDYLPSR